MRAAQTARHRARETGIVKSHRTIFVSSIIIHIAHHICLRHYKKRVPPFACFCEGGYHGPRLVTPSTGLASPPLPHIRTPSKISLTLVFPHPHPNCAPPANHVNWRRCSSKKSTTSSETPNLPASEPAGGVGFCPPSSDSSPSAQSSACTFRSF